MWGNLAGRLAQTDINGALEKITNAVAPRDDDDDEYYDEDDDGEEYDDDDQDDDDEEEDKYKMNSIKAPFGIVGMLTRALDDGGNDEEYDDDVDDKQQQQQPQVVGNEDCEAASPTATTTAQPPQQLPTTQGTGSREGSASRTMESKDQMKATKLPVSSPMPNISTHHVTRTAIATDDWEGDWEHTSHDPPSTATATKTTVTVSTASNAAPGQSAITLTPAEEAVQYTTASATRLKSNPSDLPSISSSSSRPEYQIRQVVGSTEAPAAVATTPTKTTYSTTTPQQTQTQTLSTDKLNLELKASLNQETPSLPLPPERKSTNSSRPGPRRQVQQTDRRSHSVNNIHTYTVATPTIDGRMVESRSSSSGSGRLDLQPLVSDRQNVASSLNAGSPSVSSHSDDQGAKLSSERHVQESTEPISIQDNLKNDSSVPSAKKDSETVQKIIELENKCEQLQMMVKLKEKETASLRDDMKEQQIKAKKEKDEMLIKFQEKEYRLLQATSEESRVELDQYKKMLSDSETRADRAEQQLKVAQMKFENELAQSQQREYRATQKSDDRVAQTMAILDERNEEIAHLKKLIRDMESKVNEHQEGAEEAEEEVEELHEENESLRATINKLESEKQQLKSKMASLESDSDRLTELQIELAMLKEERDRERAKNQSVVDSAITSHSQLESERDSALSDLQSTKQQLAAALADLEVAKADASRIMKANDNLQLALESFQDERQTEMNMLEEQRLEAEEAIKAANATAMAALKQMHERELYEIQKAADDAVRNLVREMDLQEGNLEKLRSENVQMRRSLDEAINQLQSSQEDVIDREVMKNILLDWCTLKEKSKRQQVLLVMANLLHFSDEEREKVHLTGLDLDSVGSRFVETLAPRRATTADVEHLEGSNVREKWVNFLLAETDNDDL